MPRLMWLTPDSVYLYYRRWGSRRTDGLSTCDFIAKWQPRIAYEIGAFERSGAREKDRVEFERRTKPMETLIRDAERDVITLMKLQAERGGWIAFGRRHPDAEEEVISSQVLPFLDIDFETRVATGHGMTFRAIRGLIRRQIPSCHPILSKIRKAEGLSGAAARSSEIASAHIPEISAPPLPDSARMHNDVPDCLSRPTKIENPRGCKRGTRLSWAIEIFEHRVRTGQTARTKSVESDKVAELFKEQYPKPVKPLSANTFRIWLSKPEGDALWNQR